MRIDNAAKNASISIVTRIVEQILAFVTRTVFIWFLSVEYLGVTSLFADVLNLLNLAELGISVAINVELYKPLAINDYDRVKSLMSFYKKAYTTIGWAVLLIGVILIPLLPNLINGTTDLVNITLVYCIYLAKNVLSYWFFAYKRSLLEADQKSYIVSFITYAVSCADKLVQIVILFFLRHMPEVAFYAYCFCEMLCTLIINIIISHKVDRTYTYIREKNVRPLEKDVKRSLFKNIYGVALYKLSSTINNAADSVIISAFLSTVLLGLYSNYLIIVKAVMMIINVAFNSITATIGNLNVLETQKRKKFIFNALHLASFWVYGFCIICIWVLINPFVDTIWLGKDYVLSDLIVFTMCINYLVDGLMTAPIQYRNACGLYWQSRYRAVATVIINVVLSIFFVTVVDWGIPGILLATIISRLAVTLWVDAFIVHKNVLMSSPKWYYINYFVSLGLVIITGAIIKAICISMPNYGIIYLFIRLILCLTIPNLVWWIIFHKTKEYQYLKNSVINLLKRKTK